jgi:hypothetical protein
MTCQSSTRSTRPAAALVAAGFWVLAVDPLAADRYRDRHRRLGAKSDPGERPGVGRPGPHRRPPAPARGGGLGSGRGDQAGRSFTPVGDLVAALSGEPGPLGAARVLPGRHRGDRRTSPQSLLRPTAPSSAPLTLTTVFAVHNRQMAELETVLDDHFGQHPDATIPPGLGVVTGARELGKLGDDPTRYDSAKARRDHAGTSPLTIASATRRIVRPDTSGRSVGVKPPKRIPDPRWRPMHRLFDGRQFRRWYDQVGKGTSGASNGPHSFMNAPPSPIKAATFQGLGSEALPTVRRLAPRKGALGVGR